MVLFEQKWLYRGKSGFSSNKSSCIRAKLLYSGKVVVLGESGCVRAKVVVFGESGFIRAKVVVFGQKLLLSG